MPQDHDDLPPAAGASVPAAADFDAAFSAAAASPGIRRVWEFAEPDLPPQVEPSGPPCRHHRNRSRPADRTKTTLNNLRREGADKPTGPTSASSSFGAIDTDGSAGKSCLEQVPLSARPDMLCAARLTVGQITGWAGRMPRLLIRASSSGTQEPSDKASRRSTPGRSPRGSAEAGSAGIGT